VDFAVSDRRQIEKLSDFNAWVAAAPSDALAWNLRRAALRLAFRGLHDAGRL
jgi:hypothetical protein